MLYTIQCHVYNSKLYFLKILRDILITQLLDQFFIFIFNNFEFNYISKFLILIKLMKTRERGAFSSNFRIDESDTVFFSPRNF